MTALRAALVVAGKDLRQRRRDRSAIVMVFVAPLVIAALMSSALTGADDFGFRLAVVDLDGGEVAQGLTEALSSPDLADVITTVAYDQGEAARRALDDGDVGAVLVVPAGFTEAATAPAGRPIPLEVLSSVDSDLAGQVTAAIADGVVARVNGIRLSVASALAAGAPSADVAGLVARATARELPLALELLPSTGEPLKLISYYAPAMSIFFALFAVSFGSKSWFAEAATGTLDRLSVAPIRRSTVLVGKGVPVFVLSTAGVLTMWVTTSALFGADWGHPVPVVLICLAVGLSVVALTALVSAVATTERQAESLSSVVTFGLAMVGGSFLFIGDAPEIMQTLALGTPNGLALRAFTDMSTSAGGFADQVGVTWRPLAGIVVFAVVMAAVAAAVARRRLA